MNFTYDFINARIADLMLESNRSPKQNYNRIEAYGLRFLERTERRFRYLTIVSFVRVVPVVAATPVSKVTFRRQCIGLLAIRLADALVCAC